MDGVEQGAVHAAGPAARRAGGRRRPGRGAVGAGRRARGVPDAPAVAPAGAQAESHAAPASGVVEVETDVLRLLVDGGSVLRAELLAYPQTRDPGSPPVVLFDNSGTSFYAAQSGWVSAGGAAPNHLQGFVPAGDERRLALAPGQDELVVPFVWQGPDGVSIRRSYVLSRGQYAITVRDDRQRRRRAVAGLRLPPADARQPERQARDDQPRVVQPHRRDLVRRFARLPAPLVQRLRGRRGQRHRHQHLDRVRPAPLLRRVAAGRGRRRATRLPWTPTAPAARRAT